MSIQEIIKQHTLPTPALRRALREAADVSQSVLADYVGVSRAAISRWESGDRTPRGTNRIAYVAALRELRELVRKW